MKGGNVVRLNILPPRAPMMMNRVPNPEMTSLEIKVELRRTARIKLEVPIRVYSFGGRSGYFAEDTRTLVVNRDGALIALRHPVEPEGIIWIINLENLRQDDFRVVRLAGRKGAGSAEWGVEHLDKSLDLWEDCCPYFRGENEIAA
jgi:hypothetical protein